MMTRHFFCVLVLVAVVFAPLAGIAAEQANLFYKSTIYHDGKDGALRQPEAMACKDSLLVIADTGNGRLVRMNWQDDVPADVLEIRHERLPFPIKVAISSGGEILALDGKLRTISRFNSAGEYLGEFVAKGESELVVRSFRVDAKGNVYLLDLRKGRVLKVAADGQVASSLPFPASYHYIADLAVNFKGDILLLDSAARNIYVAREGAGFVPLSSNLGDYLDFPASLETNAEGVVHVVDYGGSGIASIDQEGNFIGRQLEIGWKDGFLRYPTELCFGSEGKVFIVDRDNSRIQVFKVGSK